MPLVKISAVLLAISLWGAWVLALAAVAVAGPGQGALVQLHPQTPEMVVKQAAARPAALADDTWQQTVIRTARKAVDAISAGYDRAPMIVIVLAAMLILPAVALVSPIVRGAAQLTKRERRRRPDSDADSEDLRRGPRPGPNVPAWPAQAWLSIEGEATGAHPIAGEMIRIGRHPDNEVWLTDTSVHRYHAVIHRTEDADFCITDLSGEEGNGVRINGTRRAQSPLADGDVIEVGKARITFASIPI
jgi:FHA domain